MKPTLIFIAIMTLSLMACSGGGSSNNTSAAASSSSAWSFTSDNIDFGITEIVSPETILLSDDSVRLYTTGGGGISVYLAADGVTFTEVSASTPQGSDPTLIKLDDGSYRIYYVDQMDKTIKTATSPDGLAFTFETSTGISNTTGKPAWGVPDTISLPDGSIRMFWVDTVSGSDLEIIKSAISSDGVTFTKESGSRTTGGYVDPYILKAETGDWVGLFSTGPGQPPQKLYIGTSTDGLTWSVEADPIITVSGGNALDPTAVDLGDGSYRVYYVATTGNSTSSGFYLTSGVLRKQ